MKIVFRNLIRHPLNPSVIIVSLALGIACVNLIAVFLYKEYHADSFHKNKDRIYKLQCNDPWIKGQKIYYTLKGAGEYIKNNFSEVEDFCNVTNATPSKLRVGRQDYFDVPKTIALSSSFFNIFSYELLNGSADKVLVTPQDMVISEELARKYFGNTNPIGQQISLPDGDKEVQMTITGVFRKPIETSQLDFDMAKLIGDNDSRCYLLLRKNTNVSQFEKKLAEAKSIPILSDGNPNNYFIKDLQSAYFDTSGSWSFENNRDKKDLMIALVISLLILAVALFNYLGLANNRLVERSKENTIRRLNGGSKANILTNFMKEMAFLNGLALLLSLALMFWLIPFFNQLTNSTVNTAFIFSFPNWLFLLVAPMFILLATLCFAYLSFRKWLPISLFRFAVGRAPGKVHIPVLSVFQLAISIILIIASSVIIKQIRYIANKDIGLNKEVFEVRIPPQHKDVSKVFKAELEKFPQVELVSLAQASPVLEHMLLKLRYKDDGVEKDYIPALFPGDQNYLKVLGVKVVQGENFSVNAESNSGKCIVNESLAKLFPGRNLIGQQLPGDNRMTIVGVAKDFHYGSLKNVIEPGYIAYSNKGFYLMVKPTQNQQAKVREIIAATWEKLILDYPLKIESVGERYEWMHRENSNYASLIGACCIISVFLSMMGLFAISFNRSRRRVKEVGIRKVNGARTTEVMAMLNSDFIKWIAIAFVIACPIAWYAMHQWLQNFAYKTELSWWVFALAGMMAMAVALLTVSWQSWRAAARNPVESLRYE